MPIPQRTISYNTYVKQAMVEALREGFVGHPDELLRLVNVDIDFPQDQASYPVVIVRFYERKINNAGVGHEEWLPIEGTNPVQYHRYKHYLYNGDIEFAIYAESTLDRDLIADGIVEVLTMGDLESYTEAFFERIYKPDTATDPQSLVHFINLDTDNVQGFGESQVAPPWQPEDFLVYQKNYRIAAFGEFYSLVPTVADGFGMVDVVEQYPYNPEVGEAEPNPDPADPGIWTETT
jgi:hypothetical protein